MTIDRPLLLLGAGGHASVVADAARAAGWTIAGCLEDDPATGGATGADCSMTPPPGVPHLGWIRDLASVASRLGDRVAIHAAVGSAVVRRRWLDETAEYDAPPIVHPSAVVSPSARLSDGVFVGPLAVINARTTIGRGVIVNSGAIVEHDGVIGSFAHIAPRAVLGGGVRVGDDSLIGLGTTVRPMVRIGRAVTTGAGAVVVGDVPDASTVTGVPATARSSRTRGDATRCEAGPRSRR